jgi:hypothetical protein
MTGQEASNHKRRKDSNQSFIDSTAHNQILKQQKQLNGRNHHIPINITLNVNILNSPIKRHSLANWIKKKYTTICCLQETRLIDRNKHWLRVKGQKKIYQANVPRKQAGVAILISDKVDFKPTMVNQDIKKDTSY